MKTINAESIKTWFKNFARKQITVCKDGKVIFEIPAPAALLAFCCFSKLTILACIAALVMGYGFSFGEKAAQAPADTYEQPAQYVEQLAAMMNK